MWTTRVRGLVQRAMSRPAETSPPGPAFTPRDYFLALSEYERRAVTPIPAAALAAHELRVSSQNGEDGVIQEVLRRTRDAGARFFVEFGVQNGSEGNAVLLADLGWRGLFMEANDEDHRALERKYRHGPVRTRCAVVTPENVEALFAAEGVPEAPAVVSIDVDGEDYWIWEAIRSYRPILVVIEYNADLPAGQSLVQARNSGPWAGTNDFGASLGALVTLGEVKGYRLVHTDLSGSNAFFVRSDLSGEWPPARVAGPNYWLQSRGHAVAERPRPRVDVRGDGRRGEGDR